MKTSDFYYELPEELIAQTPLERRDSSRLLHMDRKTGALEHRHFYDIAEYLNPGDTLVVNNSRVLPARLLGRRPSGGAVEVLLLQDKGGGVWECLTKPGRKTQIGQELLFGDDDLSATVVAAEEDGNKLVQFHYEGIFLEILERLGKCRCRPISKRNWKTENGTKRFIPKSTVLLQHRRRDFILPKNCSKRFVKRAFILQRSRCMSDWEPFARSKQRKLRSIICTVNCA
jgi:S-adenosylmethionine:tRNA-ribosyltransferase-isomerase (queuine synthetase)